MSKINTLIFRPLIARRTYAATWALLIAWVCFAPWPHDTSAAEINGATSAKPSGFADIVAKVKPAVIAVTVRLETDARIDTNGPSAPSQSQPFTENSPFYRYFFGDPEQRKQSRHAREIKTALGSGFFISPDGYAVTNDHVVQHGVSFQIATEDGTAYTAKVVGADLRTDLALLKVDGRNDFPYVSLPIMSHASAIG